MRIYNALRLTAQALLFPQRCVLCRQWVVQNDFSPLCSPCLENLESFDVPLCERCGILLPGNIDQRYRTCQSCRERALAFDFARASGPYEGRLRDVIRHFKFDGCRTLASPLGRRMADAFRSIDWDFQPDWIVPVPLHPRRRRERGFDQTLLLARILGREIDIPVCAAVQRIRPTRPQFGLDSRQRRENLRDAFRVTADEWKSGASILIVDDVMTTGTTVDEMSRQFRREKPEIRIMVLTVARVPIRSLF